MYFTYKAQTVNELQLTYEKMNSFSTVEWLPFLHIQPRGEQVIPALNNERYITQYNVKKRQDNES